jgi:hypothetical protein
VVDVETPDNDTDAKMIALAVHECRSTGRRAEVKYKWIGTDNTEYSKFFLHDGMILERYIDFIRDRQHVGMDADRVEFDANGSPDIEEHVSSMFSDCDSETLLSDRYENAVPEVRR